MRYIALLSLLIGLFRLHDTLLLPRNGYRYKTLMMSTSEVSEEVSETKGKEKTLTRKEYLIAVRNRLFAVEEQIWLHEYAANRRNSKVKKLSDSKYDELVRARGDLLVEYPLTQLYLDLQDAEKQNLTFATMYLERMIDNFKRQMPLPMNHVNQIAVVSYSGQVMTLMRGQGAIFQRLSPSSLVLDDKVQRQFQQPAFSGSGKFVSFTEMHFVKASGQLVKQDVLVYEVPNDPKTFGDTDLLPAFDSGELPDTPLFLRFSPNEEQLAMICEGKEGGASLVLLDWAKYYRKDLWLRDASEVARLQPRKTLQVMQGDSVFFTYTTADPRNATIVAHCEKTIEKEGKGVKENAVWLLQKRDTGGVMDYTWQKVANSGDVHWCVPVCHSAGGGDNVLLIEDGHLVTKSISRWKRNADGSLKSKKLMKVTGQVHFLVSPDNSKVVVMQEDLNIGLHSLMVIEGEAALDPASDAVGTMYEIPNSRPTIAFWWSPDSTKILCMGPAGVTKEDVAAQKKNLRSGSEMQMSVYNFPLQELRDYDEFKATPYFMKTNIPFFSQYAQVYNPWAPDSRSFIYATSSSSLFHTPLVGSKYSLGMDKWQNVGGNFGTWSRQ